MSRPYGLLDTSAVIRIDEFSLSELPDIGFVSAITLAELSLGPLVAENPQELAERQNQLQRAIVDYGDPLPFNEATARAFAEVAACLRQYGGKRKARSFDALIAATAKANGLPLYTCNAKDFINVKGLNVVALGK